MPTLLERIPTTWQAVTALAAAISLGALTTLTIVGFVNLPEQVAAHERDLRTLEETVNEYFENLDDLRRQVRLANCLEISERSGQDWRRCVE